MDSSPKIIRWDELDRTRWDEDGAEAQIVAGENMQLIRAVYDPGSTYEIHSHPHEQFSLLLSGRMRLTVGDETREIGPGDGWYAASNVPHGGEILGNEPAVFIDVYAPATPWIYTVFDQGRTLPSILNPE